MIDKQMRENSGLLFLNKNKKEVKHPDYTGKINAKGILLDVGGWIQVSVKGDKYLSLSMRDEKEFKANFKEENEL